MRRVFKNTNWNNFSKNEFTIHDNLKWLSFQKPTSQALYYILNLRQEIFMIEQKCLYQDIDNQG